MKVAVTAQGKDRRSKLDPHFARARYFLVVDIDQHTLSVCHNIGFRQTAHLAGTQAAGALISLGVQAAIVGHIGPKAFATFKSAGVRVFQAPAGTVAEAIDSFRDGLLVELSGANAEEHWPQPSKT
jgi:predicted Fe-Mo cluster-binding NifX family protein